jgi:hypothetical protein
MCIGQEQGYLSEKQRKFARELGGLLSDEGVHALIAELEFARLLRNIIGYGGVMSQRLIARSLHLYEW